MGQNTPVATRLDFIIGDFQDSWDALARQPDSRHRGNFMFARQAMTLLEFACRMCVTDRSGRALSDLENELKKREPRYFSAWPGVPWQPKEFRLPGTGATVLSVLFDLVRNGQAHQYQQIPATLGDGKDFQVGLTGADHGLLLGRSLPAAYRNTSHLRLDRNPDGDLWMKVCTDLLFLDFRDAIHGAGLHSSGLGFDHLSRDASNGLYSSSSSQLFGVLKAAGH